jgi:hypothetical protein
MVSTWVCDGIERSPGTMMSSAAVTDSHRTPSGDGAERIAHRFDGQASGIKGVGDQGPASR